MNNPLTPYQQDILSQPQALRDTMDYLGSLRCPETICTDFHQGKWSRIILTGMGSSYYVLYPLYLRLLQAGKSVWLIETSELIHHQTVLIKEKSLIVAASQSGESAEIVRLMEMCSGKATVIGITNNERGLLASKSTYRVLTRAGEEATVSCKTYVTALAAQCWLGDQMLATGEQFSQLTGIARQVENYLSSWPACIPELKERLGGVSRVYLTGRGISLAAAGTGGLILKESTKVPSEGMSSAAFRHGPFEMSSPESYLLVFDGLEPTRGLNRKLVSDFLEVGGKADLIRQGGAKSIFSLPVCSEAALPIMEILPVQLVTLALADLRGIQAGKFSFGNKITTDE